MGEYATFLVFVVPKLMCKCAQCSDPAQASKEQTDSVLHCLL